MEKKLWNNATKALKPYVPGEQPAYRCIKLNTNENPYPPSENVKKAIKEFNYEELRKYPDPNSTELKKVLSKLYNVDKDMLFLGNGSDEVLAFAFRAFFDNTNTVAFPDVTYSFYPVYAQSLNLPFTQISLNEDFTLPLEEFFVFDGGIVIANPNAPTGAYIEPEDIRKLVSSNRNRIVIVDEAYIDFGGESAIPLVKEFDNLLVIQTVSKSRALAGIRVGYAIGSPSLIKALECIRDSINSYTIDSLAQTVAIAALEDGEWFDKTVTSIIDTRKMLYSNLESMGFSSIVSKANFIFTTNSNFSALKLYEGLKEKGILIRYFNLPRIDNYIRITVGTPDEIQILCDNLGTLVGFNPGKGRA